MSMNTSVYPRAVKLKSDRNIAVDIPKVGDV